MALQTNDVIWEDKEKGIYPTAMSIAKNAGARTVGGEIDDFVLSSGSMDFYLTQTALMQLYSSWLIHIYSRY